MEQKQHEDQQSRPSQLPENHDSVHQQPPSAPPQLQKCPRCDSLSTKFCYYNNYNLSQPRYFCKTCRRYWTQGGTLRNVPVGGGCRKRNRPRSATSSPTMEISRSQPLQPPLPPPQLQPNLISMGSKISTLPTSQSLSNLAAMQSFIQQQGNNQDLDLTSGIEIGSTLTGGDASTSIFQGLNFSLFKSRLDQVQPLQIQLEKDDEEKNGESLYQNLNANLSSWNINLWNSPSESNTDGMPGSSLNACIQWPNFPGFGGPPRFT